MYYYAEATMKQIGAAIGVNVFESIDLPATWHIWTPSRDLATNAS